MPTGAAIREAPNAASSPRGSGPEFGQPLLGRSRMDLEFAATLDTTGIYPSCCSRAIRAWRATSNVVVTSLKASHASFDCETAARPV